MGFGNIQRSLLRLVINKLGVFDTDALDLDKFDFSWGQTNSVVLKNVSLLKDSLSSFLQLPPTVQIQHAKIAILKITITINSISPSISLFVDGIDLRLKILPSPDPSSTPSNPHPPLDARSKIPFTEALTASVIQEEIATNRAEVEEALSNAAPHMEEELGTGTELSLPHFLRKLLQNILNNFSLSIVNVHLSLDPGDLPESGFVASVSQPHLAAVLSFHMDKMEIEGLTSTPHGSVRLESSPSSSRRNVTFHNAVASILTNYRRMFSPGGDDEDGTEMGDDSEGVPYEHQSSEKSSHDLPTDSPRSSPLPSPHQSQILSRPSSSFSSNESAAESEEAIDSMSHSMMLPVDMTQSMHYSQMTVRNHRASNSPTESFYSTVQGPGHSSPVSPYRRQHSYGSLLSARSDDGRSIASTDLFHDANSGQSFHMDSSTALSASHPGSSPLYRSARFDRFDLPYHGGSEHSSGSATERRLSASSDSQCSETPDSPRDGVPLTAPIRFATSSGSIHLHPHGSESDLGGGREHDGLMMSRSIRQLPAASSAIPRPSITIPSDSSPISKGRVSHSSGSDGDNDGDMMTQSQVLAYSDEEKTHLSDDEDEMSQFQLPGFHNSNPRPPSTSSLRTSSSSPENNQDMAQSVLYSPSPSTKKVRYTMPGQWDDGTPTESLMYESPVTPRANVSEPALVEEVTTPVELDPYAGLSKYEFFKIGQIVISVPVPSLVGEEAGAGAGDENKDKVLVDVDNVHGAMDVQVVKLLDLVLKRLTTGFVSPPGPTQPPASSTSAAVGAASETPGTKLELGLKVESVVISFVDSLREELSNTLELIGSNAATEEDSVNEILSLRVADFGLDMTQRQATNTLDLKVGTVGLHTLGTEFLSFNQKATMNRAVTSERSRYLRRSKSSKKPHTPDIQIAATFSRQSQIRVTTAPLVLDANLTILEKLLDGVLEVIAQNGTPQKLEDFLELETSTVSSATTTSTPTTASTPTHLSSLASPVNGVSTLQAAPSSTSSSPLIEVLVGGVNVLVHGPSSCVSLHTSQVAIETQDGRFHTTVEQVLAFTDNIYRESSAELKLHNLTVNVASLLHTGLQQTSEATWLLTQTDAQPVQLESQDYASLVAIHFDGIDIGVKSVAKLHTTVKDLVSNAENLGRVSKLLPQADGPGMVLSGDIKKIHANIELTEHDHFVLDLQRVQGVHLLGPGGQSGLAVDDIDFWWRGNQLVKTAWDDDSTLMSLQSKGRKIPRLHAILGDSIWVQTNRLCVEYKFQYVLGLGAINWKQVMGEFESSEEVKPSESVSDNQASAIPAVPPFEIVLRDTVVGLSTRKSDAKVLVVFNQARLSNPPGEGITVSFVIQSGGIMVIEDVKLPRVLPEQGENAPLSSGFSQYFLDRGFVRVCDISDSIVTVNMTASGEVNAAPIVAVDLERMALTVEGCADSVQTLTEVLGQLGPEAVSESKSGPKAEKTVAGPGVGSATAGPSQRETMSRLASMVSKAREEMRRKEEEEKERRDALNRNQFMVDASMVEAPHDYMDELGHPEFIEATGVEEDDSSTDDFDIGVGDDLASSSMAEDSTVVIGSWEEMVERRAREEIQVPHIPTRIHVRNLNVTIKLFDGYDWARTRYAISNAKGSEGRNLVRNEENKLVINLHSISADIGVHQPGHSDVQVQVHLRVHEAVISDFVTTSTWATFLRYDRMSGRDLEGMPMFTLRLQVLQPVPDGESELSVAVNIEPLQLQVDQDSLNFLLRFLEFKKPGTVTPPPANKPRFQQVQVNTVQLQLDYKAKRIDYNAVRSGRFGELVNASVLERANLVLPSVLLYGIDGPHVLHVILNQLWTEAVIKKQIPSIVAALGFLRPISDVAEGMSNLVYVPWTEYQRTGRVIPGVTRGVAGAASSLLRLGARTSAGMVTLLESTEEIFSKAPPDEKRSTSRPTYSKPQTAQSGLEMAFEDMARDWKKTQEMMSEIPRQIRHKGTVVGAAKVLVQNVPAITFRPPIILFKSTAHALFGASNQINRDEGKRLNDKYK